MPSHFPLLFAVLLADAARACVPPDCDRPDFGTCVNACCRLDFSMSGLQTSAKELVDALATAIKEGGPDHRYFAVENNTVQPWSSNNDFVVQAIHETAKHLYNDTLHFAVSPPAGQGHDAVTLHAFSHSQDFIKGNFAYGDHGQNYKNIVTLVKSLGIDYTETTVFGCPASNSAATTVNTVYT
eukprot:gnl/TRDRNA2_/TRDRNA2_88006_c0_seq1.p1 gnl/TRDRNA2_/TRDRNA2_88006_c0~~gnl/TRDRNA2_/TRDRNA2_88006_c0_seq1.p1  ORF type:complete len:183 (-),score=22.28 gnl/TRDRNA2_/TRDRNA2_88006_c0_seq1:185-733(-)